MLLAIIQATEKHRVLAVVFFVVFGTLDSLLWGASLKKIPHGAWVPLMIGVAMQVFVVMFKL